MGYKKEFELNPEDIDLIEASLDRDLALHTQNILDKGPVGVSAGVDSNVQIKLIRDLLGKLHNQKIFYGGKGEGGSGVKG